jgi:hypothetical protein
MTACWGVRAADDCAAAVVRAAVVVVEAVTEGTDGGRCALLDRKRQYGHERSASARPAVTSWP